MRQSLTPHPDFPSGAVSGIEVAVARTEELMLLRYVVSGKIDRLLLPAAGEPARTDELWKHTCFEAFVRAPASEAYTEFNFSPSTQWAAYRFSGYRADMQPADIATPRIEADAGADRFELSVSVALPATGPRRLGLSAIVEETNGAKSYWALKHPPGKPDFHHTDGFALELAAP